nr:hypothetical protein [Tanacetum cinerariifolium]
MDVTRETGVSSPTDMLILVLSSPGVPLRATPTQFALHMDVDTQEIVVELLADKYGHAVFVLFDMGSTHSVISSAFATRVTTTPTLLDHVLCISTPMQDYVRITHVYRDLPLQFDDKIRAINALPLDMCEFDIILGFLATIHDTTSEVPSIHDQPIVSKFPDVFPDELLGIPPVHEVEFNIELIPGAEPISKTLYRMALI